MLIKETLELQLNEAFMNIFPEAMEAGLLSIMDSNTPTAQEKAKTFGTTIASVLAPTLAKSVASAIDYYVKSGVLTWSTLTGTCSTGPVTILPSVPLNSGNPAAGITPNTIAIK